MKKIILILIILIFLLSCSNTIDKYIIYCENGKIKQTWYDEIIETNNNIYMIKEYFNITITNEIEWYVNIRAEKYKEIILNIEANYGSNRK